MNKKINLIVNQLKELTLLEASELVKEIEKNFNIDTSISTNTNITSSMNMEKKNEKPLEQKTTFDIILEDVPTDKKIAILKVVRSITGLGLKEVKNLVESSPQIIKKNISQIEVDSIKEQLVVVGAGISIK
ncbi:MAG: 50S ribosomal protein L7/L12 [Alphaproteobacteria bacterium]|nr:50S ribosomal protein L7/L12 [Alphaproteobacteria bacterium]